MTVSTTCNVVGVKLRVKRRHVYKSKSLYNDSSNNILESTCFLFDFTFMPSSSIISTQGSAVCSSLHNVSIRSRSSSPSSSSDLNCDEINEEVEDFDNSLIHLSIVVAIVNPICGISAYLAARKAKSAYTKRNWKVFENWKIAVHVLTCIGLFSFGLFAAMAGIKLYHTITETICYKHCSFLTNIEYHQTDMFKELAQRFNISINSFN